MPAAIFLKEGFPARVFPSLDTTRAPRQNHLSTYFLGIPLFCCFPPAHPGKLGKPFRSLEDKRKHAFEKSG